MTLDNRNATFYTYEVRTYYPGSDILEGVDPERAPKVSPGPPVPCPPVSYLCAFS